MKDHLGNVRSTVTAEPMDGVYLARHEIASANIEQLLFDNIPSVRDNKPGSLSVDDGMAAKLDGSDPSRRVGTAIMLGTMPGDRFNISVDAWHDGSAPSQQHASAEDVIGSLIVAEKSKGKSTGRQLREYQYTNSKGEKVSIRKDNATQYKEGGTGDQGEHYNGGNTGEKLKQHHNYGN